MKKQMVSLLIALLVGFCIGVCMVCMGGALIQSGTNEAETMESTSGEVIEGDEFTLSISHLEDVLEPAVDLITTRYYYTDADTYENYKEVYGVKIPLTIEKVVFTYSGVISIGMDLSAVTYEIDNELRIITIELPEITILANEIDADSFEYHYVSNSVFNTTQMGDYTELIGTLKQQKADEISENTELKDKALENTKLVLKQLLATAELTQEYTIRFR